LSRSLPAVRQAQQALRSRYAKVSPPPPEPLPAPSQPTARPLQAALGCSPPRRGNARNPHQRAWQPTMHHGAPVGGSLDHHYFSILLVDTGRSSVPTAITLVIGINI